MEALPTESRSNDERGKHDALEVTYRIRCQNTEIIGVDRTSDTESTGPGEQTGEEPTAPVHHQPWLEAEHQSHSEPSGVSTTPIDPPERSISELIDSLERKLTGDVGHRMAKRLRFLAAICEEEAPRLAPLAETSVEDLLAFADTHSSLRLPSIVLDSDGNIRCIWRRGGDQFALEFLGSGHVSFVLMVPDPKSPHQRDISSGRVPMTSVFDLLRPFGISELVGRGV